MEAGRRILVVNDDVRLARSVTALLADAGYEVRVAFDGSEALAVVRTWAADLVLLDLIMPHLDGWGFLARLQAARRARRPKVLVWSAAGADELKRARTLGASECLARGSSSPHQLLDAIARLLHGGGAGDGKPQRREAFRPGNA